MVWQVLRGVACVAASAVLLHKAAVLQQGRLRAEATVSSLTAAKARTIEASDLPLVTRAPELYTTPVSVAPLDLAGQQRAGIRVAVVLGSASAKSAATVPVLVKALRDSTDLKGERIWVISDQPFAGATSVAAAARAAGAQATELLLHSPERFAEVSGIDAVPMLLVFSGMQLQFVAVGELTASDITVIRRTLQERGPVKNPFRLDTAPDALLSEPTPLSGQ